jgi:hypothetical protein
MLTETALMGIACLISNAPAADREALVKDLTPDEVIAVQEKAKLCVPDRLKQILEEGREQAARGEAADARRESQPTFRC